MAKIYDTIVVGSGPAGEQRLSSWESRASEFFY